VRAVPVSDNCESSTLVKVTRSRSSSTYDFLTPILHILLNEQASVSLYTNHETVECPEVRLGNRQCPVKADKTLNLKREEPILDLNRQRNLFKIWKRGEECKVLSLRADLVLPLIDGRDGVVVKDKCRNFVNFVILADR
jgi:hypothetical protein